MGGIGFLGFRVSGFPGSRVSGFQGSRVPGFQGFRVSGFQGFRVSGFQGFGVCCHLLLLGLRAGYCVRVRPHPYPAHVAAWGPSPLSDEVARVLLVLGLEEGRCSMQAPCSAVEWGAV